MHDDESGATAPDAPQDSGPTPKKPAKKLHPVAAAARFKREALQVPEQLKAKLRPSKRKDDVPSRLMHEAILPKPFESLLEAYKSYKAGTMDLATLTVKMSHPDSKGLLKRLKFYGDRVELILKVMDDIALDVLNFNEAAKVLDLTPPRAKAISKLFGVVQPIKYTHVQTQLSKLKWLVHKHFSAGVIRGEYTLDQAAGGSELSDRQVRREVAKMLKSHLKMSWKDMTECDMGSRRRMAAAVEVAEGISDQSDKELVRDLVFGVKTLTAVAIQRVIEAEKAKEAAKLAEKKLLKEPRNVKKKPGNSSGT